MISYGGIYLIEPTAELAGWIAAHIPPDEAVSFYRWRNLSDIDPRGALNWLLNRPVQLNSFINPYGASRWGIAYVLADEAMLGKIRVKAYATPARYNALPLKIEDSAGSSITTNLRMLPAVPLSKFDQTLNAYLIPLVDDRYFHYEVASKIDVVEGTTTWDNVYDAIALALGVTINRDPIHADYLTPGAWIGKQYEYLPMLLDMVAASVGQRIVRTLDGNFYARSATSGLALAAAQVNTFTKFAGGMLDLATDTAANVPATVSVAFPRPVGTAKHLVVVNLDDLGLTAYRKSGRTGTHLIHNPTMATGSNNTELNALATRIATDFYLWRLAALEIRYVRPVSWTADGLHDVSWQPGGPTAIATVVHRSEWEPDFGTLSGLRTLNASTVPDQDIAVGRAGTDINLSTAAEPWSGTQQYQTGWAVRKLLRTYRSLVPSLNVDPTAVAPTVTVTIATPAVVSWTAHGLVAGSEVVFATTGALPTGLVAGVTYFVIAAGLSSGSFRVSLTAGGAAVNTTGTQSGVHTAPRWLDITGHGLTIVNVPPADAGEGDVIEIRAADLTGGKFDGWGESRSAEDWSDAAAVWGVDLAGAVTLNIGDRYPAEEFPPEVGGPFLASIIDGNTESDLTDTDFWRPLSSDPTSPPAYAADIVPATTIANGSFSTVSNPDDFSTGLNVNIVDANSSITNGLVTIVGRDSSGKTVIDYVRISALGTHTYGTSKTFKFVSSVTVSELVGAAAGDTIAVSVAGYPAGVVRSSGGTTYFVSDLAGVTAAPPSAGWTAIVPSSQGAYTGSAEYDTDDVVQESRTVLAFRSDCCGCGSSDPSTKAEFTSSGWLGASESGFGTGATPEEDEDDTLGDGDSNWYWRSPPCDAVLLVETWGVGGDGGVELVGDEPVDDEDEEEELDPNATVNNNGGGGGGGYSKKIILATANTLYKASIYHPENPLASLGAVFMDEDLTILCSAASGLSAAAAVAPSPAGTPGQGGQASDGNGDVKFSGGNGGDGFTTYVDDAGGTHQILLSGAGAGGGSGGPAGNGGNGEDWYHLLTFRSGYVTAKGGTGYGKGGNGGIYDLSSLNLPVIAGGFVGSQNGKSPGGGGAGLVSGSTDTGIGSYGLVRITLLSRGATTVNGQAGAVTLAPTAGTGIVTTTGDNSVVNLTGPLVNDLLPTVNGGLGLNASVAAAGQAPIANGSGGFVMTAVPTLPINLASQVSGLLPSANGGTGANSSGFTGIAHIVAGVWTASAVSLTADVTGALPDGNIASAATWNATTATVAGLGSVYQPLDADLTALAALAGTNTIYYRSAANTWTAVTISTGLDFTGGVLTATAGVSDGDKGDITVSGSGTVWTIDAGAVTLAKQADMATASLVYRKTAGAGPPEVNTLATLKTDLGLTGTNSGDQTSIVGITGTIAQFNTACTDADFATGGGTATGTNTGDQSLAGLQPLDGDLTAIAALAGTTGILTKTAANTWALDTAAYLTASAADAAYQPLDSDLTTWAGLTPSANAQSLVTSATYSTMRGLLDLEAGVDFYSIAAANTLLNLKAPLASPTFTGVPAAPTAAPGNDTTQLATTAFVTAAVAAGGGGVPTTITVADTADSTCYLALFESATGNLAPKTDSVLTYNASTGALSAVTFVGALTGNVTGNVSGSSGSCTGNSATVTTNANLSGPITSVGNATSIASQTGTGTKFVVDDNPTLITPKALVTSAATTTAAAGLTIGHNSSGTPAAGFGVVAAYQLESSTTDNTDAANVTVTWATATHASRKARVTHYVYDTAAREAMRMEASGTAPMIGFLGTAAVVAQTGDIGTAAVTFGLMSGTPTFAKANLTGSFTAADVVPAMQAGSSGLVNCTLACSVASGALTIALKTYAGTDATAADPIRVLFRSATAATGTWTERTITAALSLVVPSGATMGMSSATAGRLWVGIVDDGGTLRICVVNCLTIPAVGSARIYPFREDQLVTSTTISTGADSSAVVYTDAGVTSKSVRIVGYIDTLNTTAGTWLAPTWLQLYGPGVPLPGMPIQEFTPGTLTGTVAVTLTWPVDDTIPTQAETTNIITMNAALSNACNVIDLFSTLMGAATQAQSVYLGLYQASSDVALDNTFVGCHAANNVAQSAVKATFAPGTTSSVAYKTRCAAQVGTFTAGGSAGVHYIGYISKLYGVERQG